MIAVPRTKRKKFTQIVLPFPISIIFNFQADADMPIQNVFRTLAPTEQNKQCDPLRHIKRTSVPISEYN